MPFYADEELKQENINLEPKTSSFISDDELLSNDINNNSSFKPVQNSTPLQQPVTTQQPVINQPVLNNAPQNPHVMYSAPSFDYKKWVSERPTNNILANTGKDAAEIVGGLAQLLGQGTVGTWNAITHPKETLQTVGDFGNSIANDFKNREINVQKFKNGELTYPQFLEAQRLSARENHPALLALKDALVQGIKEQYGQGDRDISKDGIDWGKFGQSFLQHPLMNGLDVVGVGEIGKINKFSNAVRAAETMKNIKKGASQAAERQARIDAKVAELKAKGEKVPNNIAEIVGNDLVYYDEQGNKFRYDINGNKQYFDKPTDNLVLRPFDNALQSERVQKWVQATDGSVQNLLGTFAGMKENNPLLGKQASARARLRQLEKDRKNKTNQELVDAERENNQNFGNLTDEQGKDIVKDIEGKTEATNPNIEIPNTKVTENSGDVLKGQVIKNETPEIPNSKNVTSDAESLKGQVVRDNVAQTGNIINKTNADGIVEINGKFYWDNAKGEIPDNIAPKKMNGVIIDGKSYVEIGDVPKDLKQVEQPFEAITDDVKNVAKTEEKFAGEYTANGAEMPTRKNPEVEPVKSPVTEENNVVDNSIPKEQETPVNDVPRSKEDIQNEIAQINQELSDARRKGMPRQKRAEFIHEKNARLKELKNELKNKTTTKEINNIEDLKTVNNEIDNIVSTKPERNKKTILVKKNTDNTTVRNILKEQDEAYGRNSFGTSKALTIKNNQNIERFSQDGSNIKYNLLNADASGVNNAEGKLLYSDGISYAVRKLDDNNYSLDYLDFGMPVTDYNSYNSIKGFKDIKTFKSVDEAVNYLRNNSNDLLLSHSNLADRGQEFINASVNKSVIDKYNADVNVNNKFDEFDKPITIDERNNILEQENINKDNKIKELNESYNNSELPKVKAEKYDIVAEEPKRPLRREFEQDIKYANKLEAQDAYFKALEKYKKDYANWKQTQSAEKFVNANSNIERNVKNTQEYLDSIKAEENNRAVNKEYMGGENEVLSHEDLAKLEKEKKDNKLNSYSKTIQDDKKFDRFKKHKQFKDFENIIPNFVSTKVSKFSDLISEGNNKLKNIIDTLLPDYDFEINNYKDLTYRGDTNKKTVRLNGRNSREVNIGTLIHETHHNIIKELAKLRFSPEIRKLYADGLLKNRALNKFRRNNEEFMKFRENIKSLQLDLRKKLINNFNKRHGKGVYQKLKAEYTKLFDKYYNCDLETLARKAQDDGIWQFSANSQKGLTLDELEQTISTRYRTTSHQGTNGKSRVRLRQTIQPDKSKGLGSNRKAVGRRTNRGDGHNGMSDGRLNDYNDTDVINELFDTKNKFKNKLKQNSDYYKSIGKLSDETENANIIDTFAAYKNGITKRDKITDSMREEALKVINSLPEDKKPFYVPRMYDEHLTVDDFKIGHYRQLDDIDELKHRSYTGDADKIKNGKLTRNFNIEKIANRLDEHRIKLDNMSKYIDDITNSLAKPLDKVENLQKGYVAFNPEKIKSVFFGKTNFEDLVVDGLKEHRSIEASLKNALQKNADELKTDAEEVLQKLQNSTDNLYQIPEKVYEDLVNSVSYKSNKALNIWDIGTDAFKKNVLGLNAKWVINNRIGNTIMAAFKGTNLLNPMNVKRISKLSDDLFPAELTGETFHSAERMGKLKSTGYKGLDNVLSLLDGNSVNDSKVLSSLSLPGKVVNKISKTVFDTNQKFEVMDRKTAYLKGIDKKKKEILKTTGKKFMSDKELLTYAKNNPGLKKEILKHVDDTLGDYSSMSHIERSVIKRIIPFYSWLRTITRHTLSLPKTNPIRTSIMSKISAFSHEERDDLPFYQKNAVDTDYKSEKDNRELMLNYEHSVPYSTFGESGENPMSLFDPAIKNAVDAAAGVNTYNGMPLVSKRYASNTGGGYIDTKGGGEIENLPASEKTKAYLIKTLRDKLPGLKQTERVLGGIMFSKEHKPYDKLYDTDFGGYMEEDIRKNAKGWSGKEQLLRYVLPIQKKGKVTKNKNNYRYKKSHKRMLNKE